MREAANQWDVEKKSTLFLNHTGFESIPFLYSYLCTSYCVGRQRSVHDGYPDLARVMDGMNIRGKTCPFGMDVSHWWRRWKVSGLGGRDGVWSYKRRKCGWLN